MEPFIFELKDDSFDDRDKSVKELTEILDFCGFSAKIDKNYLVININNDKLKNAQTRHAGRKRKANFTGVKVAEVFEWQRSGVPLSEILNRLEIKQATYYRRLKYYQENGYSEIDEWY